jgi:hypothetical protein
VPSISNPFHIDDFRLLIADCRLQTVNLTRQTHGGQESKIANRQCARLVLDVKEKVPQHDPSCRAKRSWYTTPNTGSTPPIEGEKQNIPFSQHGKYF